MRVIAGRFGSRTLDAPAGSATRPTSDRVREAIFSVLGDVEDARVLDLYAGSGALGIEALSRGAAHVTFVEARPATLATLRKNLSRLGIETEATVLSLKVERAARRVLEHAPYDVVFIDPPWQNLPGAADDAFRMLKSGALSPSARVLLEHPSRQPLTLAVGSGFTEEETRAWGDTQVTWFVPEMAGKTRV